jgi:hypothetical protein
MCDISEEALIVLRNDEPVPLSHGAADNESWSSYRYQSAHCYIKACVQVQPRPKTTTATKRAMVTQFFTEMKFSVLRALPREQNFNQDHFLAMTTPELSKKNTNAKRKVGTN